VDLGIARRAVVVGGASSGLGRATAERLAAEGCRLAIWARGAERIEATAVDLRARFGVEVVAIAADAGDPDAARIVADAATAALGPIDIVVLNAGGPPPVDPTATDAEGWARAFQLLATTPIDLATRLLPPMRARRWGRVVAILSWGVRQPIDTLVYSNAGRSAIAAWLKTTSRVVAADGVTVNGVLPGRFDTPRIDALDRAAAERSGLTLDAVRAASLATVPTGRYGRPEELASLVAYLCSEPAGYQTGTFSTVDGGMVEGMT
jgi:3-oxoacyl-[acyl-carrier protein] reductase